MQRITATIYHLVTKSPTWGNRQPKLAPVGLIASKGGLKRLAKGDCSRWRGLPWQWGGWLEGISK